MAWSFPNRRLRPALAAAAAYLVACAAQRGLMLSLVRRETRAGADDLARVVALGTEQDLLVASALVALFALWTLVVPRRAWSSTWHRAAVYAALAVGGLATLAALILEAIFYVAHRTRIGPGSRERLGAVLDAMAKDASIAPVLLSGLAVVALVLVLGGILHGFVSRAFEPASTPVSHRLRDLALASILAALLAGLVATRDATFPGRRSLQEAAGNGAVQTVRLAWARVSPRGRPPGMR